MNDVDFPRPDRADDFDLMAMPGQARPGDRSRRDDDRYLMLEALLSARRTLYVSWSGRNARDDAHQPPSVLVSQLRGYLDAGWRSASADGVSAERTTIHPLQPFSRRYFEGGTLSTHAREWRAAHREAPPLLGGPPAPRADRSEATVDVDRLCRFLRKPIDDYFRARLDVVRRPEAEDVDDDEAFAVDGLGRYRLRAELIEDPEAFASDVVDVVLARRVARLRGAGTLPIAGLGDRVVDEAVDAVRPAIERWLAWRAAHPGEVPPRDVRIELGGVVFEDRIDGLQSGDGRDVRLRPEPSRLLAGSEVRADRLVSAWVEMLVASVGGVTFDTVLVGCDATLTLAPWSKDEATAALSALLAAWRRGRDEPLPIAPKTALAFVAGDADAARQCYEGQRDQQGENAAFGPQRLYPDFAALTKDGRFETFARSLYGPLSRWARSATIDPHTQPQGDAAPADEVEA